MEFYQKLQQLRKASGMSQEEFASQLNVSRQAVSKWENGQGFPETEKLVQISTLFNVSLDYLLKEDTGTADQGEITEQGMYVSREMAEGYLLEKKKHDVRIAIGVVVIILGLLFPMLMDSPANGVFFMLSAAVGVGIILTNSFLPSRFTEVQKQPLTFDPAYHRELKSKYPEVRRRFGIAITAGVVLLILAVAMIVFLQETAAIPGFEISVILPVTAAISVFVFIVAGSALSSWNILVNNTQHTKELRDEKQYGWISGGIMGLASMVFLMIGLVWGAWHPGWLVFPIAAILSGLVVSAVKHSKQ